MSKYLLHIILLCLFFSSCDNKVKIRLKNTSQSTLTNVKISTPSDTYVFDTIRPLEATDYRPFNKAYRYAWLYFICEGDTFEQRPKDYVGEKPLMFGKYTYEISPVKKGAWKGSIDAEMK